MLFESPHILLAEPHRESDVLGFDKYVRPCSQRFWVERSICFIYGHSMQCVDENFKY